MSGTMILCSRVYHTGTVSGYAQCLGLRTLSYRYVESGVQDANQLFLARSSSCASRRGDSAYSYSTPQLYSNNMEAQYENAPLDSGHRRRAGAGPVRAYSAGIQSS